MAPLPTPLTATLITLCALLWISNPSSAESLTASFYGSSYLQLPLDDASRDSSLRMRFKTSNHDGLLFVAAGESDYCTIELQNGGLFIRINMGSGEVQVVSSVSRFNDVEWHEIQFTKEGTVMTLFVDGTKVGAANATGPHKDLNINVIYLGGLGSFINPYLGSFTNFRGCLGDVVFNSFNLFEMIQNRSDTTDIHRVTWGCKAEFSATYMPISFLYDYSFAAFPRFAARNRGKISFRLKTRSFKATVLYNAGPTSYADYLALELLDGRLQLSVNKGGGPVKVKSRRAVNTGRWHDIEVLVEVGGISLTVNGERYSTPTGFGDNRLLDLMGPLFVGGVGLRARAHAVRQRIESIVDNQLAGSMKGCIANFTVNEKPWGFRDVLVTHDIRPGCLWAYKCADRPCAELAQCIEIGFDEYKCNCKDDQDCLRPTGDEPQPSTEEPVPMLSVRDVYVAEGGTAYITPRNIILNLNLQDLNMDAEDVRFTVYNSTKSGKISVFNSTSRVFTLGDIRRKYVTYTHDGSERDQDSIILKLEFNVPPNGPEELRDKAWGISLVFVVSAVNDVPRLVLPPDQTLVLVENTQKAITSNTLSIVDADGRPKDLLYNVQYQEGFDIGYFERTSDGITGARARIHQFTQEDVNRGRITFVHRGAMNQAITISASDGVDFGEAAVLKIRAIELRIQEVENTGVVVSPGSEVPITGHNLTFKTNAGENMNVVVSYDLIVAPLYGEIQRRSHEDENWLPVSTFTQEDLNTDRIKYVHRGGRDTSTDGFRFKVVALHTQSEQYNFVITIESVEIHLQNKRRLMLQGTIESKITSAYLKAVSSLPKYTDEDIFYSIIVAPVEGSLYKTRRRGRHGHIRSHRIRYGGNFTQEDINESKISYKLNRRPFGPISDWFKFRIYIPGAASPDYTFNIEYRPRNDEFNVINEGLTVEEGASKWITQDDLFIRSSQTKGFRFNIIQKPRNGSLNLIDPISQQVLQFNASSFTSEEIIRKQVQYQHDDSESVEDSFMFLAVPERPVDDLEISQTFRIKVKLRNDNDPVRVNPNKVFNVLAGGGRVITPDDLLFYDADIDFDDSQLQYSWRDFKNGHIVLTENKTTPVYSFIQQDIIDGKLYFRHYGSNYSENTIYVSDGTRHPIATKFIVAASKPFVRIHILSNETLHVERGKRTVIPDSLIVVDTNLPIMARDVTVVVLREPRHGRVLKGNVSTNAFTLQDLDNRVVMYQHYGRTSDPDHIQVEVTANRQTKEGVINVELRNGYQDKPFTIIRNPLYITENGKKTITAKELNISHPTTHPRHIKYTVALPPERGMLKLRGHSGRFPNRFTQEDVNERRLQYINKRPGQATDIFMFEVTNGNITNTALEFQIKILPAKIQIHVMSLSVAEGGTTRITRSNIQVMGRFQQKRNLTFLVVKPPNHGKITTSFSNNHPVYIFNSTALRSGYLQYHHDGSDSEEDEFYFMVSDGEGKMENPHRLPVHVQPINDQPPYVAENRPLSAWQKTPAVITRHHLLTEDADTPPANLTYMLRFPVTNGIVALAAAPTREIIRFTQQQIDNEEVVFMPKDQKHSSFKFVVRDGNSETDVHEFKIKARPLELRVIEYLPLEYFPGAIVPITARNLRAETNNVDDADLIVFTLTRPPRHGNLHVTDSKGATGPALTALSTFKQVDINQRKIVYLQGQSQFPSTWQAEDSFLYNVSCGTERVAERLFNILISYGFITDGSKGTVAGVTIKNLVISEGAEKKITDSNLDIKGLSSTLEAYSFRNMDFVYKVTELPRYGVLKIGRRPITEGATFRQDNIKQGQISYQHNGSDKHHKDNFKFIIEMSQRKVEPNGTGRDMEKNVSKTGITFSIDIYAVNDKPCVLQTREPRLEVVQGYTKNITKDHLYTVDADTPPDQIFYRITRFPANGRVELRGNEVTEGDKFTQQDVDTGLVTFVPMIVGPGSFQFTVTDGQDGQERYTFTVKVYAVSLVKKPGRSVHLTQGFVSTVIKDSHLNVTTNGSRDKVFYNITLAPLYGMVFLEGFPTSAFTQADLDLKRVTYVQTNLDHESDEFKYTISTRGERSDEIPGSLKIVVVANTVSKVFTVPPRGEFQLTLGQLDASELAAMTGSDPEYSIFQRPRFGHFVTSVPEKRKSRAKREVSAEINHFYHSEIENGEILYLINETALQGHSGLLDDGFGFKLRAANVQPATGAAQFKVMPPPQPSTTTPTPGYMVDTTAKPPPVIPSAAPTPGVKSSGRKISNDHLIIVISVCVISLLAILLFVIVKCVKKRKKRRRLKKMLDKSQSATVIAVDGETEPLNGKRPGDPVITQDGRVVKFAEPAVQPPRGMPSTPPPPRTPPEFPRSEVSRTVPSLKVTPMTNAEADDQSRSSTLRSGGSNVDQVTFGWENIDPELLEHCRTTTPILHKNKYWV